MKRILIVGMAGFAIALPLAAMGAPDDTQKQLIQRAEQAKQKLAAAQAAPSGRERERLIMEHLKLMQDVLARMRTAKPREGLTPQQMREWIDEHMTLMDLVTGQMMDEHHMMLQRLSQ